MTQPNLDPDEVSHEKDLLDTNYQDEEQEIPHDVELSRRTGQPAPGRKAVRWPPPRKRYHED